MRSSRSLPALVVLLTFVLSQTAAADPGDPDTTFSKDGRRTVDFAGSGDWGTGVAVQPDGKIVVSGYARIGEDDDFAVARFLKKGALDDTFSGDGRKVTDFADGPDQARALAIQEDGKIVLAGQATIGGNPDFALARYKSTGRLHLAFGEGGKTTTEFVGGADAANAIAILPNGKILAAGFTWTGGDPDFALARYLPTGALDANFGEGGKTTTDFGGGHDEINAIAVQTNGKIVAAGVATIDSNVVFALARYLPGGSLDETFSGDGMRTTDFGAGDHAALGVGLQPDGKIVAAGYARSGVDQDFAVARYKPRGRLDKTFAGDGKTTTDFGGEDFGSGLILQPDGKIVVGGNASGDFALVRYLSNGSLDGSFGMGGTTTTDFAGDSDTVRAMALQSDGKIVCAGEASGGALTADFAVARYLDS
jgi:uncharacterized delta-60 repeat protein